MFQRAGMQRHRFKRHGVGLLLGWLGWGEESSLGCLWLGEVTGRDPEAVQVIRRDMQAIGLTDSAEGGGSSRRGWPLKMSVVVYVGESVAEVLGVGGQVRWRPQLSCPQQRCRPSAHVLSAFSPQPRRRLAPRWWTPPPARGARPRF
jgi:hypothetical protein